LVVIKLAKPMTASHSEPCKENGAFTLRELLVVIMVLTLLSGLVVSAARGAATRRIKVAQCAANLRQFALTTHLYANENRDRLPEITSGAWAWDFLASAASAFLRYGMEKRTFYCPGTAPRFNDKLNYLNPLGSSLWNFAPPFSFRVIGYLTAFTGPPNTQASFSLILSNQNTTILPEPPKVNASTFHPIPKASERMLLADATISENRAGTPAAPATAGSFVSVQGGFPVPHISPHLKVNLPAGGNLAFKDGHVAWRTFSEMSQRASGIGPGFWW